MELVLPERGETAAVREVGDLGDGDGYSEGHATSSGAEDASFSEEDMVSARNNTTFLRNDTSFSPRDISFSEEDVSFFGNDTSFFQEEVSPVTAQASLAREGGLFTNGELIGDERSVTERGIETEWVRG